MSDREFDNINGIKVCDQTARNSIPTKTSQLENDSDFATNSNVDEKIANAQLGGGELDLSGYVTKEVGNANQITFSDGKTFQGKLDAGELKGEKGDKGEQGPQGSKGEQGIQGIKGDKGDKGDKGADGINAETPNFTFAINMIASDQPASVSTTGTYPNLLITFNIPQNSGGSSEPIISKPLYTFGLLSDTHVDGDGTDEASANSDLNNAISFLENAGANFIAYCGDMSSNGNDYDYTALKACLETSTVSNHCIRGNHDAYSLSNGYASATGCKDDYVVTQGNDLLIFISCADINHDTGGLTTSKLDWLENLLQTNTDTRVFLFYHYYIEGTSGNGNGHHSGTLNPSNPIALRFINMVKQYPNLIYCNGHSHMRFSIQDQDANANYYHNDGECYYIHVPSTSRPRYPSGDSYADYYEGSEGYLVEVYEDKVLFKPIDFIASEYLTKYNYTANVAQGANAPTVPSEPSLINITWNDGIKIDRNTGTESSSDKHSASNFIAYDSSKTYTLALAGNNTNESNVFICYYDSSQAFISCGSEYVGIYDASPNISQVQLPVVENASYIKLRYFSLSVASNTDKSNITLTVQ